jgi:hypothetical protein
MVQVERQLEALAFKTVVPRLAEFLQRESRSGWIEGLSHQAPRSIPTEVSVPRALATSPPEEPIGAGERGEHLPMARLLSRDGP